jgi:NADH dehydrogenase FAD-containing subunit
MCRICRARGLGRGARGGGGASPAVAFVDASRPPEDDEIPCGFATADARCHAETSISGADGDGPPPPSVTRVVVGAGVAGTCCAEELCRLRPRDAVVLVTAGDAVKSVRHVERVTKNLETVHIEEKPATALSHANLSVVRGVVVGVDLDAKLLFLEDAPQEEEPEKAEIQRLNARNGDAPRTLAYHQLCVCAGAAPRSIFAGVETPVASEIQRNAFAASITITVRDVESVEALRDRLIDARRVLLVGNGGIAMELADALCRPGGASASTKEYKTKTTTEREREGKKKFQRELVWAARHSTIGDAFFDRDAAAFLNEVAEREGLTSAAAAAEREEKTSEARRKRRRGDSTKEKDATKPKPERVVRGDKSSVSSNPPGNAAGPDWTERVRRSGSGSGSGSGDRFKLRVVPDAELAALEKNESFSRASRGGRGEDDDFSVDDFDFPATAILSDGSRVPIDLIVSAVGVDPAPRVAWLPKDRVPRGSDGGIDVDFTFRSLGDASVFAAGDAACCDARRADTSRWFPMRLWSQARVSGTYVARVMCGEADAHAWGFNFELFTHSTRFFGKKTILLGLYNAQKLEREPETDVVSYSRRDDDCETFARVLLLRGKMVGAVLLGDTDLEETFENLILNETDLARFGPSLLDPEMDVGDYFD